MAITVTNVARTPYKQRWLLSHDGQAGDAVIITAAQLLAAAEAGPLRELPGIGSDVVGANQAAARLRLLGDGSGIVPPVLTNRQHATCKITNRSGIGVFSVDADVDAVNPLRFELNVAGEPGVVATAYLEIAFQHTFDR